MTSKKTLSYLHLRKKSCSHSQPRTRVMKEMGRANSSQEVKFTPDSHSWPSYSLPAWAKALKRNSHTVSSSCVTLL